MATQQALTRLGKTVAHLQPPRPFTDGSEEGSLCPLNCSQSQKTIEPVNKTTKWNGWGFPDTEFKLRDGQMTITGSRYLDSGKVLPQFRAWAESYAHINIEDEYPAQSQIRVPDAIAHPRFVADITDHCVKLSVDASDRLRHGHGHTCQEIFLLRHGSLPRLPDIVVWPGCHEHVEKIIEAAAAHNVCIIPFGGGTSVTQAVSCPEDETRAIVSLSMCLMNQVRWVDVGGLVARIEAGAIGADIDRQLKEKGLCLGHEPDSYEFSSLGGWIATRASGMKRSEYGNIEDILVSATMVTPTGTLDRSCAVPRLSSGPDLQQLILGSEGMLGVITEATVRVRRLPETQQYGSIVFPNFESGLACLRELQLQRVCPASIRLIDNMQFVFGQALKPAADGVWHSIVDTIKRFYITRYLQFDVNEMVAATIVFEGNKQDVKQQQARVYSVASRFDGVKAGEENGSRGYFLTYMIAYIRDFAMNFGFLAESFETSVPWPQVLTVVTKVKQALVEACAARGVAKPPFVSARVTQCYDAGAVLYFYFGFLRIGLPDPIQTFTEVEDAAREAIMAHGGSISHHHGVGKHRKRYMQQSVSSTGIQLLQSIKRTIDPQNIFGARNLIDL